MPPAAEKGVILHNSRSTELQDAAPSPSELVAARALRSSAPPSAELGAPASAGARRPLWLAVLRYVVPIAAVAFLAFKVPWPAVLSSLALMPVSALALGAIGCVVGTALQAARWDVLMRACGARGAPRWSALFRLYWIGGFYNTYVPGGVSGDVVRAVATQRAIPGGLPASLGIVLLERLLGGIATLLLIACGALFFHIDNRISAGVWKLLGGLAFVTAICVVFGAARLSRFLPARLGSLVGRIAIVKSPGLLGSALLLSFAAQLVGALIGHALIAGVSDAVQLADSLVNVPLINIMQYVPVAIGGAGVREAGFVALYAASHVRPEHAFAAGIAMGALQYALSAIGGLLQWFPRAVAVQPPVSPQ